MHDEPGKYADTNKNYEMVLMHHWEFIINIKLHMTNLTSSPVRLRGVGE